MGRPKLSLPLGERTVIQWMIQTLHEAGVSKILVVVGPHVPELVPLIESEGAHVLALTDETPDMRGTVEHGLTWVAANWQPTNDDALFLVPADHPVLDAAVIRLLIDEYGEESPRSIVVPSYQGRRGHPALIGWRHVPGLRALPRDCGFNVYLSRHRDETREVSCSSETILMDLDTPEDYERLQRFKQSGGRAT